MPKKRPASQWQPAGIELLDVSSLYGDVKICELAGIIGSLRGEKLRRFGIALRNTLLPVSVCRPCFRQWLLLREAPNARGSPRRRARDRRETRPSRLATRHGAAQCPDPRDRIQRQRGGARGCPCPICSRRREARIVAARQPRSRPVSPGYWGASFIVQGGGRR